MDLLFESIKMDWPVLTPIFICSILVIAVAINKLIYYKKMKETLANLFKVFKKRLQKITLAPHKRISVQLGGIISEMVDEGLRIYTEQRSGFSRAYDISSSLATRKT